jgi:hypothetical protein
VFIGTPFFIANFALVSPKSRGLPRACPTPPALLGSNEYQSLKRRFKGGSSGGRIHVLSMKCKVQGMKSLSFTYNFKKCNDVPGNSLKVQKSTNL